MGQNSRGGGRRVERVKWKQQWDKRKRISGEQPLPFYSSCESSIAWKPDSGYFNYFRFSSLQPGWGASNIHPSPALASRSYYSSLFPDNNALLILLLLFQHDQPSSLRFQGSEQENHRQAFPTAVHRYAARAGLGKVTEGIISGRSGEH